MGTFCCFIPALFSQKGVLRVIICQASVATSAVFPPLGVLLQGWVCATAAKTQPLVLIHTCLVTEGLQVVLAPPSPSFPLHCTEASRHASV